VKIRIKYHTDIEKIEKIAIEELIDLIVAM